MAWKLRAADLQDLAKIIGGSQTQKSMMRAAERFDVELSSGMFTSNVELAYRFLTEYNGKDEGLAWLQYVIQHHNGNRLHDFEKALATSPLKIVQIDGEIRLGLRDGVLNPTLQTAILSDIERLASALVVGHLQEAESKIAQDPDGALAEARMALEALTVGNFVQALDELASKSLIGKWNGQPPLQHYEYEVLKGLYGLTSTLGSHTSASRPKPSPELAQFGVMQVEHSVCLLLRTVDAARKKGVSLTRWA